MSSSDWHQLSRSRVWRTHRALLSNRVQRKKTCSIRPTIPAMQAARLPDLLAARFIALIGRLFAAEAYARNGRLNPNMVGAGDLVPSHGGSQGRSKAPATAQPAERCTIATLEAMLEIVPSSAYRGEERIRSVDTYPT